MWIQVSDNSIINLNNIVSVKSIKTKSECWTELRTIAGKTICIDWKNETDADKFLETVKNHGVNLNG